MQTSGTDQGTDWRDSDEKLEPVVEIYQGLHASYEYVGAPRAATPDKRYYHHGDAWRPKGFVWEAWAKGIKLGVQASSDHIAVHDAAVGEVVYLGGSVGVLEGGSDGAYSGHGGLDGVVEHVFEGVDGGAGEVLETGGGLGYGGAAGVFDLVAKGVLVEPAVERALADLSGAGRRLGGTPDGSAWPCLVGRSCKLVASAAPAVGRGTWR